MWFEKVVELDGEKVEMVMERGEWVGGVKNYGEGIKVLYKVEFVERDGEKGGGGMGWWKLMWGK